MIRFLLAIIIIINQSNKERKKEKNKKIRGTIYPFPCFSDNIETFPQETGCSFPYTRIS